MKISYITPTLGNRRELLLKVGESLRNQTMKDIEWIIVSKNPLPSKTFNNKLFEHQIFIYDKNVAESRNFGVTKASGEYVAFIDDDDIKYPTWGEEMLDAIYFPYDAAMCHMDVIDEKDNIIGQHLVSPTSYEDIWENKGLYFANELLISKEVFIDIGMFDEEMYASEDYEFFTRLFRDLKTHFVKIKLAAYRKHPQALSSPENASNIDDCIHKSIHHMMKKHKRNFFCSRCGKEIVCR